MKKNICILLMVTLTACMLFGCNFKGSLPEIEVNSTSPDEMISSDTELPDVAISSEYEELLFEDPGFEKDPIDHIGYFTTESTTPNVYAVIYQNGDMYVYGNGRCGRGYADVDYEIKGSHDSYTVNYRKNTNTVMRGYITISDRDSVKKLIVKPGVVNIGATEFLQCTNLTSVESTSVMQIEKAAFAGCTSLEEYVALPNSDDGKDEVHIIGEAAFLECKSLKQVNFTNLGDIGKTAFGLCSSLETFTVPKTVIKIGENAFAYCDSLESFVFEGDKPELADSIFEGTEATVYIPKDNDTWEDELTIDDNGKWHGGKMQLALYDPEKGIAFASFVDESTDIDSEKKSDTNSDRAVESESKQEEKPVESVDWKALYKEFLSGYTSQMGYKFGLLYIDEGDVPELVITQTIIGNGSGTLYTIYNGEVKDVGGVSAYGTFYYKEKGNLMMGYSLRQGYNSTGFTSIIDGQREYVHTFFDNSLSGENPVVYKMDDQEISKSEYDQKIKDLQQGMTVCDFSTLPDITDANIAGSIG